MSGGSRKPCVQFFNSTYVSDSKMIPSSGVWCLNGIQVIKLHILENSQKQQKKPKFSNSLCSCWKWPSGHLTTICDIENGITAISLRKTSQRPIFVKIPTGIIRCSAIRDHEYTQQVLDEHQKNSGSQTLYYHPHSEICALFPSIATDVAIALTYK